MYVRLGNLDHNYTSQLQKTYLYTLVHRCLIAASFRNKSPLKKKDSRYVNSRNWKHRDTITTNSADNHSAHAVAGLSKNISSGHMNSFCLATKGDICSNITEEEFTMHDTANYKYHLKAV